MLKMIGVWAAILLTILGANTTAVLAQHHHGIVIANETGEHLDIGVFDEHGRPVGGSGTWHVNPNQRTRLNDSHSHPVEGDGHYTVKINGRSYTVENIGEIQGEDYVIHVHESMLGHH